MSELPLIKVQLTAEGDILGQFDTHRQEFVSPTLILALNQLADIDLFKFYSLADSCSINIAEERGIKSQNFKGKYHDSSYSNHFNLGMFCHKADKFEERKAK